MNPPTFPARWLRFRIVGAATLLAASCTPASEGFPPVDHAKLLISLERTLCYGTCPSYLVTIDGSGRVLFTGEQRDGDGADEGFGAMHTFPYVLYPGRHEDRISPTVVRALIERFREARFFNLKEKYEASVTDHPTYVLTIQTGNGTKEVVDYVGVDAGMPKIVRDLEEEVDRAAGTERWIRGARGLVEWLSAQGFDFRSKGAAELAVYGLEEADEATLTGLVDRGLPLDSKFGPTGRQVGLWLVEGAIRYGRPQLFKRLTRRGWLSRLGLDKAGGAFADGAAGCNSTFVDVAADAGINLDAAKRRSPGDPREEDAFAGYGETALSGLGSSYSCDDEAARIATAKRLLARGADPNVRDEAGETSIFGVENLGLLNLLLAHGADPKAVDKAGNSAVFGTWTDDIVLRLLKAGASPRGRYDDGKSLKELMKERPMPKVKQWLAQHPDVLAGN